MINVTSNELLLCCYFRSPRAITNWTLSQLKRKPRGSVDSRLCASFEADALVIFLQRCLKSHTGHTRAAEIREITSLDWFLSNKKSIPHLRISLKCAHALNTQTSPSRPRSDSDPPDWSNRVPRVQLVGRRRLWLCQRPSIR